MLFAHASPMMTQASTQAFTLASAEDVFWPVMGSIIVLWLALSYGQKILKTNARERTRREIAAYIAEGSMTPEQGERLMKAGEGPNPHH